ncbi:hypothetical protein [Ligaoa zhengdingensis]|uniref:hypothetical protein n=1 Tax=Ligaoa zhengdingensis TaxID=2763658 RepID=UPI0031BABC78
MTFVPKTTKKKVKAGYKTLYLSQSLIDQINQIAVENCTSFNNVVVSMIEHCLEESEGEAPFQRG